MGKGRLLDYLNTTASFTLGRPESGTRKKQFPESRHAVSVYGRIRHVPRRGT
jgi:hypothetical protein